MRSYFNLENHKLVCLYLRKLNINDATHVCLTYYTSETFRENISIKYAACFSCNELKNSYKDLTILMEIE